MIPTREMVEQMKKDREQRKKRNEEDSDGNYECLTCSMKKDINSFRVHEQVWCEPCGKIRNHKRID